MFHYRIDDKDNPPPRDGTLIDLWQYWPNINRWMRTPYMLWRVDHWTNESGGMRQYDSDFTHWSPIVPPGQQDESVRQPMSAADFAHWVSKLCRMGESSTVAEFVDAIRSFAAEAGIDEPTLDERLPLPGHGDASSGPKKNK